MTGASARPAMAPNGLRRRNFYSTDPTSVSSPETGWIVALRRCLYTISPALPGVPPAHEFEIAMRLVRPAAISPWSALHHHGLTEQAPQTVFVLTTTEATAASQPGAGTSRR